VVSRVVGSLGRWMAADWPKERQKAAVVAANSSMAAAHGPQTFASSMTV